MNAGGPQGEARWPRHPFFPPLSHSDPRQDPAIPMSLAVGAAGKFSDCFPWFELLASGEG